MNRLFSCAITTAATLVAGALLSWGQAPPGAEAPARPETAVAAALDPALGRAERQFLEGTISAKQYQSFLRHYKPPVVLPEITNTAPQIRSLEAPRMAGPALRPAKPQFPYTNAPFLLALPEEETADDDVSVSAVELRMRELLRRKSEREKAAGIHNPDEIDPALPQRERLNALLRLFAQGKLSEEDYEARRQGILAEAAKE